MLLPTVSIAECATCGSVAHEFGKTWGAAQYFKGSIVTYDNQFKIKYLKLEPDLIHKFIEQPDNIVIEMAKGVCEMFETDIGLSTSGFATPFPPLNITIPFIWYCIYDKRFDKIIEVDKIVNHEFDNRGQFQKKVAMKLHLKFMIYFDKI